MSRFIERQAYLPDSLTLEAEGWKPCPTKNPAWVRDHPTNEEYGCRLWPDYETGRLSLVEHEKRKPNVPLSPGLKKFDGYCRDRQDFNTVLRLILWTDKE